MFVIWQNRSTEYHRVIGQRLPCFVASGTFHEQRAGSPTHPAVRELSHATHGDLEVRKVQFPLCESPAQGPHCFSGLVPSWQMLAQHAGAGSFQAAQSKICNAPGAQTSGTFGGLRGSRFANTRCIACMPVLWPRDSGLRANSRHTFPDGPLFFVRGRGCPRIAVLIPDLIET